MKLTWTLLHPTRLQNPGKLIHPRVNPWCSVFDRIEGDSSPSHDVVKEGNSDPGREQGGAKDKPGERADLPGQDGPDGAQPKDLDFFDGESEKELNKWPGTPREGGLIGFSFNPENWKGIFDAHQKPGYRAKFDLEREVYKQGKHHGDKEAAQKFYDLLQLDEKVEELKNLLPNPEQAVFISQPSTSRKNVIPVVMAENIARNLGGTSVRGDQFFNAAHKKQIKTMQQHERIFYTREYEAVPEVVELKRDIGMRPVFIVEDRLNTGGSVKDFLRTLQEQGFNVKGLIVLKGDPFIEPEPKVINFLKSAFRKNGLSFNTEKVAEKLTQREVAALAVKLEELEGKDDIRRSEFARRIQRLLDQGTH